MRSARACCEPLVIMMSSVLVLRPRTRLRWAAMASRKSGKPVGGTVPSIKL